MKNSVVWMLAIGVLTIGNAAVFPIRGRVVDKSGSPIFQATVKLQPGNRTVLTDLDGRFSFEETGVAAGGPIAVPGSSPVSMARGGLVFDLARPADVEIVSYNLRGELTGKMAFQGIGGRQFTALPVGAAGVIVHRVRIGATEYMVKQAAPGRSPSYRCIHYSDGNRESAYTASEMHRAAAVTAPDNQVIEVTKEGYVDYNVAVIPTESREIEVRPAANEGTVTDIDGNVYQTVKIGNQIWTARNFRATRLNDGEPIPFVPDSMSWGDFNIFESITVDGVIRGKNEPQMQYCWYDNTTDPDTMEMFGALYNWLAVSSGKLAPPGWHVADSSEWSELYRYLGQIIPVNDSISKENLIAKALAAGAYWKPSTVPGAMGNDYLVNNLTGFAAMPAGSRTGSSAILYLDAGEMAYWWSANEEYPNIIRCFLISNFGRDGQVVGKTIWPIHFGFGVRLVKDR